VLDRVSDEIRDSPPEGVLVAEHEEILGRKTVSLHASPSRASARRIGGRSASTSVVETALPGVPGLRLRPRARAPSRESSSQRPSASISAVAPHLVRRHRTVREVLGRGTDHRERAKSWETPARTHLALAELRRPPSRDRSRTMSSPEGENAEPRAGVPCPRSSHHRVERALTMTDENSPRTLFEKEIRRPRGGIRAAVAARIRRGRPRRGRRPGRVRRG
jgi:hypothetical protein